MNMKGLKMLKELTQKYVSAFNQRDIEEVANLLNDNFALEDPIVKRIEGKDKCLSAIKNIFEGCKELSFSAKNIFQDQNTTFIEFTPTSISWVLKTLGSKFPTNQPRIILSSLKFFTINLLEYPNKHEAQRFFHLATLEYPLIQV